MTRSIDQIVEEFATASKEQSNGVLDKQIRNRLLVRLMNELEADHATLRIYSSEAEEKASLSANRSIKLYREISLAR